MIVHAHQHDTVDAICWRYLGATRGVVEQTLELNPGLVDQGPVLRHGTRVRLPDVIAQPRTIPMVNLWD